MTGAPYATWFNADIYDEAGIDHPHGLTWDEYLEQAIALTDRDDRGRARVIGGGRGAWIDWIPWQAGGDVLNDEGTECLMGEPEANRGIALRAEPDHRPPVRSIGVGFG